MTISELITALQQRREKWGDVEVIVSWEHTRHEIDNSNVYLAKDWKLIIDADGNHYKQFDARDWLEGEDE